MQKIPIKDGLSHELQKASLNYVIWLISILTIANIILLASYIVIGDRSKQWSVVPDCRSELLTQKRKPEVANLFKMSLKRLI